MTTIMNRAVSALEKAAGFITGSAKHSKSILNGQSVAQAKFKTKSTDPVRFKKNEYSGPEKNKGNNIRSAKAVLVFDSSVNLINNAKTIRR